MANPILQMLGSMHQGNSLVGKVAEVRRMLNGQGPEVLFNRMMQNNPAFAQFVQENRGKSPEQLAQEYGIDLRQIMQAFK